MVEGEVALRCPDVDVAQRCSSSAGCPLLRHRGGISEKHPGTTSTSQFVGHRVSHSFTQTEDKPLLFTTLTEVGVDVDPGNV